MKRVIKSIVSICIAISLVPSTAFAGGQTQRCRQAGEQAQKQCLEKNAANNAIDQTTGAARAASSQPGINDNSVTDLAQNQEQQARVKDTIATCEAAQKKCEQECQSAAQTAGADDNQMMPHNPDGEYRSQVDGEKQNTCVAPLMAAKGDGMAALAALAAAAAAMMAAKSASDKGKEEENKEDRKPACEGSDGAKYAHCTDQYVSTCTSNMSAPGCDVFAARYCGASSATTPTNDTPLQTGNDNVIGTFSSGTPAAGDQFRMTAAGEGANSEFCRLYIAGKLCTFTENGKCKDPKTGFDPANPNDATGTAGVSTGTPSTSLTTGLTENDSSASNADRFSAGNTGAAGSGSGSGGGLGGGTDSMAPASVGGGYGVAESAGGFKVGSMDSGGGGGGGGGYGGSNNGGSDYGAIEASRNPAAIAGGKVASAAALTTSATDVAKQYGPSVFSISSIAYQSLCSKNKLNCK